MRILPLTQIYKPIFILYPYKPDTQQEIFQLKMKFKAWDSNLTIVEDEKEFK